MKNFDRQFGKNFFQTLPSSPGIYRFFNEADELIYVGKAKNLRRRLSQYRNAKRRKAHAKMRQIVSEAVRVEFEICENEFQALRLETECIQSVRPKWNVAGAFYFLYPMIGVRVQDGNLYICYTTSPGLFPGFQFHGSFRSRQRTRECFFALNELLKLVGHSVSKAELSKPKLGIPRIKHSYAYGFRQIPEGWKQRLDLFFQGDDFSAIEELSLLLLEKPSAVARSKDTQESLHQIRRFWRHEIQILHRARKLMASENYPVPQKDRDLLFINFREVCSTNAEKRNRLSHR